jgi:hypothetical protein
MPGTRPARWQQPTPPPQQTASRRSQRTPSVQARSRRWTTHGMYSSGSTSTAPAAVVTCRWRAWPLRTTSRRPCSSARRRARPGSRRPSNASRNCHPGRYAALPCPDPSTRRGEPSQDLMPTAVSTGSRPWLSSTRCSPATSPGDQARRVALMLARRRPRAVSSPARFSHGSAALPAGRRQPSRPASLARDLGPSRDCVMQGPATGQYR